VSIFLPSTSCNRHKLEQLSEVNEATRTFIDIYVHTLLQLINQCCVHDNLSPDGRILLKVDLLLGLFDIKDVAKERQLGIQSSIRVLYLRCTKIRTVGYRVYQLVLDSVSTGFDRTYFIVHATSASFHKTTTAHNTDHPRPIAAPLIVTHHPALVVLLNIFADGSCQLHCRGCRLSNGMADWALEAERAR
jgi:hypothetical protein